MLENYLSGMYVWVQPQTVAILSSLGRAFLFIGMNTAKTCIDFKLPFDHTYGWK